MVIMCFFNTRDYIMKKSPTSCFFDQCINDFSKNSGPTSKEQLEKTQLLQKRRAILKKHDAANQAVPKVSDNVTTNTGQEGIQFVDASWNTQATSSSITFYYNKAKKLARVAEELADVSMELERFNESNPTTTTTNS